MPTYSGMVVDALITLTKRVKLDLILISKLQLAFISDVNKDNRSTLIREYAI